MRMSDAADGAKIRALRLRRGLTMDQLAVQIGIGTETLALIELGKTTRPTRLTLAAIADGLDVPIEKITVPSDGEPAEATA